MEELKKRIGLDYNRLARMSIVEEGAVKVLPNQALFFILIKFSFLFCWFSNVLSVCLDDFIEDCSKFIILYVILQSIRVANLSLFCSHTVNGVSKLHSELLQTRVFKVLQPSLACRRLNA